jgi:type I restriction enzyme, S subunit
MDKKEAIGIRDPSLELTTVGDLVKRGVLERPIDGNHGEIHPKSADFVSEGVPFVMASDLKNGRVDYEACAFITERQAESLRKGFAKNGDVLVTHKATIGETAIVAYDKYPYIMLTPQVTYYRVKDWTTLNNRYLKAYFDSSLFQQTLRMLAGSGSTRAYLGITEQHRLPIILPALDKQEKIAAILGTTEDMIANNQRRIALLESMAQEIYREWFSRKRANRDCLRLVRFDELCAFEKGKNPTEIRTEPAEDWLPYLTADVLDGGAASEWTAMTQGVVAAAGEVMMLMDGARSGSVFRGPAGVVASTVAVIRTAHENQGVVYHYLQQMQDVIKWNNTGSAIPHANKDFINRMLVPVPVDETYLRAFNELHAPIYLQAQTLKKVSARLHQLRDTLLPRLISGRLRVEALDIQFPPSMQPPPAEGAQRVARFR